MLTSTISPTPTETSAETGGTSTPTGGTSTPTISPSHSIRDPTIYQTFIVMGQTSATLSSDPIQQPTTTILIISSVSAAAVFLLFVATVVILGVCIKARKGQGREDLHHKRTLRYTNCSLLFNTSRLKTFDKLPVNMYMLRMGHQQYVHEL